MGSTRPYHKFSEETEREIVTRYVTGEPLSKLGKAYGCSLKTISNIVHRHGEETRNRGNSERVFSAEEVATIAERWQAGESQAAIGRVLGISQVQVSRVLAWHGHSKDDRKPRGERHGWWKGGRVKMSGGYVAVAVPADDPMACMRLSTGYVPEHRLVVARSLGRPLRKDETVHHIDGDKTNNALENLQLRYGGHGKGVALVCACCGSHNIVERAI